MRDDLFKILVAEIESQVARLFEDERLRAVVAGEKFGRAPYIDELFQIEYTSLFPYLKHQICRALAARAAFRETAPHWAPELPLSSADIEKLIHCKNNWFVLVGYYARSLACANWGIHPTFRDYACGLMACEFAPQHLRIDPELQVEFPPRELAGFDRALCWGTHDRIFEFTYQLMKNEEIWRRCGMADNAKWMRDSIEQLVRVKLDQRLRDALDSQSHR